MGPRIFVHVYVNVDAYNDIIRYKKTFEIYIYYLTLFLILLK